GIRDRNVTGVQTCALPISAETYTDGPIAIRYPRGRGKDLNWQVPFGKIEIGKGIEVKQGSEIAILCVGPTLHHAMDAIKAYAARSEERRVGKEGKRRRSRG